MLLCAMPSLQRAQHYLSRRHSQTTWPPAICYRSPRTKVLMIRRFSIAVRATTSNKRALAGVLAVWAAMLSLVLGCIAIYGRNLPLSEDWEMVPAITGHQPNLLEWLWEGNNEHRLPFPKIIYLILLRASGGDFRIGMIANTVMLGGLSLAMILTARHLRGRTRLADAFLPLALLHLGHSSNMLIGWQILFVISTVLVGAWLLIIVRECWPLSPNIAIIAGLILGGAAHLRCEWAAIHALRCRLAGRGRAPVPARRISDMDCSVSKCLPGYFIRAGRSLLHWIRIAPWGAAQSRIWADCGNGCEVCRNGHWPNWRREGISRIGTGASASINHRWPLLWGHLSATGIKHNPATAWSLQHPYAGRVPVLRISDVHRGNFSSGCGRGLGPCWMGSAI